MQYKMKRNHPLQIRLTKHQKEKVKERAKALEMSISEFVRFVLFFKER